MNISPLRHLGHFMVIILHQKPGLGFLISFITCKGSFCQEVMAASFSPRFSEPQTPE